LSASAAGPFLQRRLLLQAWRLLTPRQRLGAAGCAVVFLLASALEMVGLSSAMPLVGILVDPQNRLTGLQGDAVRWITQGWDPAQAPYILAGCVAVLMVAGAAAGVGAITLMEWYGVRIASFLADRTIRSTLKAPYEWFLAQQGPRLAQRLVSDPMTVGLALYPPVMEVLYNGLFLMFAVATIVLAAPLESLLVIAALLACAFGVLALMRPMTARYSGEQRDLLMEANKIGVEAVGGIKDVKVRAREAYFARLHSATVRAASVSRLKLNLVNRAVPSVILLVGQMGILALALVLLASGRSAAELTAQLTLLVLVLARTIPAASRLFGSVNKLAGTEPFIRSLLDLLTSTGGGDRRAPANARVLPVDWRRVTFEQVGYAYPDAGHTALHNLSLEIRRGEYIGIVGASGAGKSTLVDLLLGLLHPQQGQVAVDGTPLAQADIQSWYRGVGYVPQSPFIANDTLLRNVAFGIPDEQVDEARAWRAIDAAGLGDVCRSLPERLQTVMGDRGTRLSGGQRQRLAIARALYDEPRLLVLDEATSALDLASETEVQDTIERLRGHITVVAVAHRLRTLQSCDRLVVMAAGQVAAEGTHETLVRTSEIYRDLAGTAASAA
jgi:ATP-binding cassette subfamily C protein